MTGGADTSASTLGHSAARGVRTLFVGLGMGLFVVVAVVAAITINRGENRPPSFPAMPDVPDPAVAGWLVISRPSADLRDECLSVRAAGGGPEHQVSCTTGGAYLDVTGHLDENRRLVLGATTSPGNSTTGLVVDLATGAILDRVPPPVTNASGATTNLSEDHDGAVVSVQNDDAGRAAVVLTQNGNDRVVARFSGPSDYFLSAAWWSPEGKWLLAFDGDGQNILIDPQGKVPPRALLDPRAGVIVWVPSSTS
jgi:hypothetical protein